MKFVTVTPAGRRRYLEILATYLLRNRDVIDEHHWWLNTRDPHDVAYIHRLADRYPDFFRVIARPMSAKLSLGGSIWCYLREYTDPDTIYARFDDDICYVADDAIANWRRFREANVVPFLVLGNIVNNAVCSHSHQRAGLIPTSWGTVGNECMDAIGWKSSVFARRLHHQFLSDIERGEQARWQDVAIETDGMSRFSINAISWFGRDLSELAELKIDEIDEEPFLTEEVPARLGRPNVVCSGALFGHYAYYTQRKYLERTSPGILARYREVSREMALSTGMQQPLIAKSYAELRNRAAARAWRAVYRLKSYARRRAA